MPAARARTSERGSPVARNDPATQAATTTVRAMPSGKIRPRLGDPVPWVGCATTRKAASPATVSSRPATNNTAPVSIRMRPMLGMS